MRAAAREARRQTKRKIDHTGARVSRRSGSLVHIPPYGSHHDSCGPLSSLSLLQFFTKTRESETTKTFYPVYTHCDSGLGLVDPRSSRKRAAMSALLTSFSSSFLLRPAQAACRQGIQDIRFFLFKRQAPISASSHAFCCYKTCTSGHAQIDIAPGGPGPSSTSPNAMQEALVRIF